jgi:hypothetical protein
MLKEKFRTTVKLYNAKSESKLPWQLLLYVQLNYEKHIETD